MLFIIVYYALMNNMVIKSFNPIISEDGESYFDCQLNDNKRIEISFWSFYEFSIKTDKDLASFSLSFNEWEELTNELYELCYDFEPRLNDYIQQFTQKDIDDFCLFNND